MDKHYQDACSEQRRLAADIALLEGLRQGTADVAAVKPWMEAYGLFRGITNEDREEICKSFLAFSASHSIRSKLSDDDVGEVYGELFDVLYQVVARAWTSASSKLLWCLYPSGMVIYDAFVHRALVVLRCIDPDLAGFPSVGTAPNVNSRNDIKLVTAHYVNYQRIVKRLRDVHKERLDQLRDHHKETYPYDIRIVDKLLWMIGNPSGEWKK
ncbi:hypothetical protein [Burkholderia pseudomallei]|uniref:hypothetical protein n=1 Tax=Burkholderia pseudomallei TaxID=28450 RepID=UPI0012FDEE59|nr:hypothetical protein [Burkholderia pseudomallei]